MKKIVLSSMRNIFSRDNVSKLRTFMNYAVQVLLVLLFVVEMSTLFYIFH